MATRREPVQGLNLRRLGYTMVIDEPIDFRVATPTAEEMRAAQVERRGTCEWWWNPAPTKTLKDRILARIAEHQAAKCAREPRPWEMPAAHNPPQGSCAGF